MPNNRDVAVVIEHVGEATWGGSMRSLARGGRLVTGGARTGASGAVNLQALFATQETVRESNIGTKGEPSRAARPFFAGQLNSVVDRRPQEPEQFGKIVLEV